MSVDVVKKCFEAYGAGDIPGMLAVISPNAKWDHRGPPGSPLSDLFEGHEGVTEFFNILDGTQEALSFEPREFFASGNRVVVLGNHRFRIRENGKEWESDFAMTFTVEDGLITHWRPIHDMTAEALAYQG